MIPAAELTEYCKHRMDQLEQFREVLEFFDAEHRLIGYLGSLSAICREVEGKNDEITQEQNIRYLTPGLFLEDIYSILKGQKPVLPDDILAIPAYKAEVERKEEERKRQIEDARREEENRLLFERWGREERERKERERAEICAKLGIKPEALVKLQEVE